MGELKYSFCLCLLSENKSFLIATVCLNAFIRSPSGQKNIVNNIS